MTITIPEFWAGVICTILAQCLLIVLWAIVDVIRKRGDKPT
jgi:hypothetical protein